MTRASSSSRGRGRYGSVGASSGIVWLLAIAIKFQVDEAKGALKPFTFNVVFEPEATQEDVLEHSGMKR